MSLSLIIPTYNRSALLKTILLRMADQTDLDFEVVVAIDGATDDTEDMLAQLEVPYRLNWVNTHCKGYGLAVARNMGILAAKGEIVALIDDDSFLIDTYVEACKSTVKKGVISGGPRTPLDKTESRQLWKMRELAKLPEETPLSIADIRRDFPTAALTECNIFLFRQDIIDMGMFSERLKIYGFIGQEFFERALYAGMTYQYVPKAETVHDRQQESSSGLNDKRKAREIRNARALRTAFMTPKQFEIQRAWAKDAVAKYPEKVDLPPFPISAIIQFPYRFMRNRGNDLKHWIRRRRA